MPSLNALRAFEAAARLASFSLAADELCVTQGAISRHIRNLEDFFSFELFERSHGRIMLTAQGRAYLEAIRPAFDDIRRSTELLFAANSAQSRSRVSLRVHAYRTTMELWILPLIADFQFDHPNIEVHPHPYDERTFDFSDNNADVSIQMLVNEIPGMQCDLLKQDKMIAVCKPETFFYGDTIDENSFYTSTFIRLERRPNDWMEWCVGAGVKFPSKQQFRTVWDVGIMYKWLLDGRGIGLVHEHLARRLIDEGSLIRAHPHALEQPGGFFLVRPEGETEPHISQFRSWLIQRAATA